MEYHAPTKMNQAPHNSLYKFIKSDYEQELFVQLNFDKGDPRWIRWGNLLEQAFSTEIEDETFRENVIKFVLNHINKNTAI